MHIAIAGNIGAGKTTLTELLSKHYKWDTHYEDVDDQLVFAYDEAHATKIVLETYHDAKFVFQSRPAVEQSAAA